METNEAVEVAEQPVIAASDFMAAIRAAAERDFSDHIIEGDIDLAAIDYPRPLVIKRATFRGHVDLHEARFARSVDLSGCKFEANLDLAGARVDGSLFLVEAEIRHRAGQIDNSLTLREAQIHHGTKEEPNPAYLDHIHIEGDLDANGLKTTHCTWLESAKISGSVHLVLQR